ncbi:MAG: hypothetical protein JXJ20_08235 [Anaerolineae bacterium]|nr:hypothetical protein [Anaerolineae bacterium]
MNVVLLQQTATHLTRQVKHWDRRLRLAKSVLWEPRGLIVGVAFGLLIAMLSRMRPWLLPEQIALITALITLCCGLVVLMAIWLIPQPTNRLARYFDRRFNLKDRISTALELTAGVIPFPERLAEHQLSDAVDAARQVRSSTRLPVRVRVWEIVALVALAGLLAYMLLSDNPQTNELLARRDLEDAISDQIADLEKTLEDIQSDDALTEAEKEALAQPLEDALDILEQPDISQQEAIAALAEAGQALEELTDGVPPDQKDMYGEAASALAESEMTSDLAQALKEPDLGDAADAVDELAEDLGEEDLTEAERESLAEQLEQAAEALEENNPALAEKLREAARALREGDIEQAQETLREAAAILRQQQQQLENSPMAQSAQAAADRVNQGQQDLAQAGRQNENSSDNSQQGQPQDVQSSDQQSSAGTPQSAQGQQPVSGTPQAGGTGEDQASAAEGGEGVPQDGNAGDGQSQGQTGAQAVPDGQANDVGAGEGQGQVNMAGAGEGAGGAGVDTTAGSPGEGGEVPSGNTPGDTDAGIQEYDPAYDPSTLGGQTGQYVDAGGQEELGAGIPLQEGEFGPNPAGESILSYTDVYGDYQGAVSDALESGRIPIDQRDVIHDYFSSLEP